MLGAIGAIRSPIRQLAQGRLGQVHRQASQRVGELKDRAKQAARVETPDALKGQPQKPPIEGLSRSDIPPEVVSGLKVRLMIRYPLEFLGYNLLNVRPPVTRLGKVIPTDKLTGAVRTVNEFNPFHLLPF